MNDFYIGMDYDTTRKSICYSLTHNDYILDTEGVIGNWKTANFVSEIGKENAKQICIRIGILLRENKLSMKYLKAKTYRDTDVIEIKTKDCTEFHCQDFYFKTAFLLDPKTKKFTWYVVLHD